MTPRTRHRRSPKTRTVSPFRRMPVGASTARWERLLRGIASLDPSRSRRLWAAFLMRGVADVRLGHTDALEWLAASDPLMAGFEWVCEELDIPPALIRGTLAEEGRCAA